MHNQRVTFSPPDPPLTGGVVTLRPWRADDVSAITVACQDPEIQHWLPVIPVPYLERDAQEFVSRATEDWLAGSGAAFAITEANSDDLLGAIGVRPGSQLSAVIGYWVAAQARGRGVATLATVLASRWALRQPTIERLELFADVENAASQRVAERAGFSREGVLRSHLPTRRGRRDSVLFSLLPSDLD